MSIVRLTVDLSDEVVDALRVLAAESGTSVTEQLRLAVSSRKHLLDHTRAGGRLYMQPANGDRREVSFE